MKDKPSNSALGSVWLWDMAYSWSLFVVLEADLIRPCGCMFKILVLSSGFDQHRGRVMMCTVGCSYDENSERVS